MTERKKTNARATSNAIALCLAAVWIGACERNDQQASFASVADQPAVSTAAITNQPEAGGPRSGRPALPSSKLALPSSKPALPVSFPQELRVDDESVNAFIERALTAVAGGDYELYRLLWTVRDEPSSRGDYEQRWHGVSAVQLRAIRRIILTSGKRRATGAVSYALLADFTFDPADPPFDREPLRGVVWVVVKERGDPQSGPGPWRLSKPSKSVKQWLREKVAESTP